MRIAIIVFTIVFHHIVIGQNETKTKVIETTKNFFTVRDSELTQP